MNENQWKLTLTFSVYTVCFFIHLIFTHLMSWIFIISFAHLISILRLTSLAPHFSQLIIFSINNFYHATPGPQISSQLEWIPELFQILGFRAEISGRYSFILFQNHLFSIIFVKNTVPSRGSPFSSIQRKNRRCPYLCVTYIKVPTVMSFSESGQIRFPFAKGIYFEKIGTNFRKSKSWFETLKNILGRQISKMKERSGNRNWESRKTEEVQHLELLLFQSSRNKIILLI